MQDTFTPFGGYDDHASELMGDSVNYQAKKYSFFG
jgi:hypothetical protein